MSSAGQVIGGVIGGVIGYFVGGPSGAYYGFTIGMGIGGYLDQPAREGPRLDDLRTQLSVYGNPIPFEYGCNRHAGTVIWPNILEAVEHEQTESAKGGPEQKTYSYTMSFAVLVCEGPIAGIRRIWANKKLVYDVSTGNDGATRDPAISGLRIYRGTETQDVDPLIEATDGASPAYLGYAYVVFEDYDVTEMNGRLPQFEFEVVSVGSEPEPDATSIGAAGPRAAYDPNSQLVWSVTGYPNSHITININDILAEVSVDEFDITPSITAAGMGDGITYVPSTNEFWVVNLNGTDIIAINADTKAVREIQFGASWTGIIHYCPANGDVIMATTNVAGIAYVIDPTGPSIVAELGITGSVFGLDQIVSLEGGYEAVLYVGNVAICDINGASSSIVATYANTDIGGSAYMAADTNRNRLVIVNDSSSSLIVLDLDTGLYTTHALSLPEGSPSNASLSLHELMWHEQNDKYYVTAHQAGLGWTLLTVNPETFEVEVARVYNGPTNAGTMIEIPGVQSYIVYTDSGTSQAWKIPVQGSLDPTRVALSSIVSDLCLRANLEAGDIDVSELTDMVDGYIVPRQMSARAAIEPLQKAYYFDAVESDDKIKFVKRGSAVVTTIPKDDRAAHVAGQEMPANLEIRRAFETELPIQLDVEYADVNADHQIGNQYDRRITKDTRHRANIQLPLVMPASKAKQIARVNLYDAWQTTTFRWTTTRKYAHLEPTDRVSLPTDEATYVARITNRRDQPTGIIEWEARQDSVEVYTQSGDDAVTPGYSPQTVFQPATTVLELLDTPILRDEDQNKGFYIAMCGTSSSWPGAEVFRSEDDGSTYNSVLVHSVKAAIGTATDALANFTGGNVFDEGNTVTVEMIGGATLSSYTESQVLNGYGIAALGAGDQWEIIQYKTATLVGENTYQLSGLLRGRRGTEWAMSLHEVGDTFVLGSETAWRLYNVPTRDLNTERRYKAPAFRTRLSDAAYKLFTDQAARRRPYSVANLKVESLSDGGIYVTWAHRSLVGGEWLSGSDVAIDSAFTTFNVTFSTIDGDVRKSYSTTAEFYGYSAAQIASDFGGTPPVIKIRVAQNNSDYGDGVGVSIRTDNPTPIYDVPAPDSPAFEPPQIVSPIDGIDPQNPVFPPGNQYFGNEWGSPCLWDGSRFIAPDAYQVSIEVGGPVWTSTDGLNFTQLASSNLIFPARMLAFDGTTYIACPYDSYNLKNWYSTDLQNWTECTYDAYPSGLDGNLVTSRISKVLHIGGRFIALTETGEIMSSTVGHNWQHKCNISAAGAYTADLQVFISPIVGAATSFAYGNGVYVVVAYNFGGNVFYSTGHDGPYTAMDVNPVVAYDSYPPYLYDVIFDDGYFYAVGARRYYFNPPDGYFVSTPVILKSSDGSTWSDVSPAPTLAIDFYKGNSAMRIFALSSGRLIVIGENADYYSDDAGATWVMSSRLDPNESGYDPATREFKGAIDRILGGATNGSFVAAREMYFKPRHQSYAGQEYTYLDSYFKPIIFDGDDYTPDLFTPYVP